MSAKEGGSVLIFFHSILDEIGENMFEEVWFVLSVDVGYIFEYSLEVAECFFFEVSGVEEI